jgi:hypothetical protein
VGVLIALALTLGLAAPRPAAPAVAGPRDTTLERPVYTFSARGATGFRCAFDSRVLHRCARRYSQRLEPGLHTLRVRSVGRGGALSRIVAVRVRVRLPVPQLEVMPAVAVGRGAGIPAPNANGVWVPVTSDGTLVRVAGGAIASRTTVGVANTSDGVLDAAVADDRRSTERAIWATSDAGRRITRVDPLGGAVTARIDVADRPGGLTNDARSLWAFHFLQGPITRVDLVTASATGLEVAGARATGIAWGDGSLWLLTTQPSQVLELDPGTGAVRRTIDLRPPFTRRRSLIDTWWLAFSDQAAWATLPNNGAVARVDATTGQVRYIRIRYGDPFGVAVGAGSAWVATDRAVLQLDGRTAEVQAAALLPTANRTGFVSIAYGFGAAWLTNYDRGTLTELRAPRTPR